MKAELLNANGEKDWVYPVLVKIREQDYVVLATADVKNDKSSFEGILIKYDPNRHHGSLGRKLENCTKSNFEIFDGKVVLSN